MRKKVVDFLASGCYSGYAPWASGTAGSALAVVLATLLYAAIPEAAGIRGSFIAAVALTAFAIVVTNAALQYALYSVRAHDPRQVVIDEIAGYFVTVLALPKDPLTLGAAFLAFRIFDIWKPFPIRRVEKLPRGYGIVLDDVVAGVYAGLSVHIMLMFR